MSDLDSQLKEAGLRLSEVEWALMARIHSLLLKDEQDLVGQTVVSVKKCHEAYYLLTDSGKFACIAAERYWDEDVYARWGRFGPFKDLVSVGVLTEQELAPYLAAKEEVDRLRLKKDLFQQNLRAALEDPEYLKEVLRQVEVIHAQKRGG